MKRIPFARNFLNSTRKEEISSEELEAEIDAIEPIEVDTVIEGVLDEYIEPGIQIAVSEEDINSISDIAANLEITTPERALISKRPRDTSVMSSNEADTPPPKKLRNVTMDPPVIDEPPERIAKHVVKQIPDIEDVHLFSKPHLDMIHSKSIEQSEGSGREIRFLQPRKRPVQVCLS